MTVLRERLLEGRTIALDRGAPGAVRQALKRLGATVDAGVPPDALVFDAAAAFGEGGLEGLSAALEGAWAAIGEVVAGELIPAGRPGKIVLLAPRPGAGPFAEGARAALENLARTLSVEWARYAVTAVAIAPGEETTVEHVAELICYLLSPAGDYFSGCRFELGAAA
jgi:NAD(P)-dependent dehydrogenase (short-subunit alcohol dehydrogenase family)